MMELQIGCNADAAEHSLVRDAETTEIDNLNRMVLFHVLKTIKISKHSISQRSH